MIQKKLVALALTICCSIVPSSAPLQAADDEITHAYRVCLGRDPEPAGLEFWRTQPGTFSRICASPESAYFAQGSVINAGYAECLGRYPDFAGFFFWVSHPNPYDAICASDEAKAVAGVPGNWVLLGSGEVWGPPVLRKIAACESGRGGVVGTERYDIMNGDGSPAAGAYQFLPRTWKATLDEMNVSGPASAAQASPELQDEAAVALATEIRWGGVQHWNPSKACWN